MFLSMMQVKMEDFVHVFSDVIHEGEALCGEYDTVQHDAKIQRVSKDWNSTLVFKR